MDEVLAPDIRYVEILFGDDLRKIALRELGDAALWLDLILLNDLRPPYIAEQAALGVLAYGDLIAIPSFAGTISAETDPVQVYGTDLRVSQKKLTVSNGDFDVSSGVPNLLGALERHVVVDKRELEFHPEFGCHVRSVIGQANGPAAGQLAAFYVKSALLEDVRVASVASCDAEMLGDQIRVTANVVPITGKPVEVKVIV